MHTDAEIFASEEIVRAALADESLRQVVNVAALPGVVGRSLAMADIHYGYGFCIGGVACFDAAEGIVLPGGVGYDINCGVRLIATSIPVAEMKRDAENVGSAILKRIPTGLTDRSNYRLDKGQFERILKNGAAEIVSRFAGRKEDLQFVESGGKLEFDSIGVISRKALERGHAQVGTLGSGNHFIEVQSVEEVFDERAAALFGLQVGMVALMIHTGSRGFGHQVATDYIETLRRKNLARIKVRDPQLIYAEIKSTEGRNYLQALNAASNFAWANRHLIMEDLIALLEQIFHSGRDNLGIRLVYDQAHNIAKFESHRVAGQEQKLLVHRKGATRAFAPGHPDLPALYRASGQPVLLPGSMGSSSYVLRGTAEAQELTFASSAHGAGRRLSRHQAIKFASQFNVRDRLRESGIHAFSFSNQGLREEIPEAYKKIDDVVDAIVGCGISQKVARLKPLIVIKG
jgi:tRNA-splicing ligase RtcB